MEEQCFSTNAIPSLVNQCHRTVNPFVLYINDIFATCIQPKYLYPVLFVVHYLFNLEIYNYLNSTTLFIAISLLIYPSLTPICRCTSQSYGYQFFDNISIHIITIFSIVSQLKTVQVVESEGKKYKKLFELDQQIVLIVLGIILSISISTSLGESSVFTILATYVELTVLGCIIQRYGLTNLITNIVSLILSIVAVCINYKKSEKEIVQLSAMNLTAVVLNFICFILSNLNNLRRLVDYKYYLRYNELYDTKKQPYYAKILHFFAVSAFVFSFGVWGGL